MATRGAETKTAMVEAGLARLQSATVADFLAFLRPEDIADAAGKAKSTFFHHWRGVDDYLQEVMEAAWRARDADRFLPSGVAIAPLQANAERSDIIKRVREVAVSGFDAVMANPNFGFYLLNAAAGDEAAVAALGQAQEAGDDHIGMMLHTYLTTQDREVRDPFTPEILAATISAIAVGIAIRARANPERFNAILFADIVTALIPTLVTLPDDDEPLQFDDYIDHAMTRNGSTT